MASVLFCPRPARPPSSSSSSSSINHSLFGCTTRIPLYIHPSLWSQAHLVAFHIAANASSPPTQKTPTARGSVPELLLGNILKPKDPSYTPFTDIMHLLTSTIASIDRYPKNPTFLFIHDKLKLEIGIIKTDITPRMYVEHTNRRTISVPFLAYSDSEHRKLQRAITLRSRHSPLRATVPEDIAPSDIAVLLAMAQKQHHTFPKWSVYRTYLISPNYSGTYVQVLIADVTVSYLQCLRDPWLPLTERLNITRSVVAVSEGGVLDVVKGILEGAPKLPRGRKMPRAKRVKTSR